MDPFMVESIDHPVRLCLAPDRSQTAHLYQFSGSARRRSGPHEASGLHFSYNYLIRKHVVKVDFISESVCFPIVRMPYKKP